MELHGHDVEIATRLDPEEALRRSVEVVMSFWPSGITEINESKHDISIFVYRSVEARISWDKDGWTPGHARDMIYLLANEPGGISLTVEDLESDLGLIVEKIRSVLS